MSAKILPLCRICGSVPRNGLYDGFRLKGSFICSHCEAKMLHAECGSAEYKELVQGVRTLLFSELRTDLFGSSQRHHRLETGDQKSNLFGLKIRAEFDKKN